MNECFLVSESSGIVGEVNEVARQVDPLPAGVVSIDEYLVS